MTLTPEAAVWAEGPWTHNDVAANGARFHTAELGTGPLVLFLHGFPMYWWTWRHQLQPVADAGYTAVAMDLRGYGGSDQTPHGYDPLTLAADVSGVIRSLGHPRATVVGHGWGGLVAWTAAARHAATVRAIAPVSMPHPVVMRRKMLRDPEQRRQARYALRYQLPFGPERALTKDDARSVEQMLHQWSRTPGWPDANTALHFRRAIQMRSAAHCALEYHRWALRSIPRTDGRRFLAAMATEVQQPVLHILGSDDPTILNSSSNGSEELVSGRYSRVDMPGIGHFPHEEDPGGFTDLLLAWLRGGPEA